MSGRKPESPGVIADASHRCLGAPSALLPLVLVPGTKPAVYAANQESTHADHENAH
jgi:hypothetical protein